MFKIKNISAGWVNFIKSKKKNKLNKNISLMADRRIEICKSCISLVKKQVEILGKNIVKYKCNQCNCSFPAMVYAPHKNCPLGLWEK